MIQTFFIVKEITRYQISISVLKPAFHDADTDTDILARIVATM